MKTCTKCNLIKPLTEFTWKPKRSVFESSCVVCVRQHAARYKDSPKGRAIGVWHGILARAGNKDGRSPSYATVEVRMTKSEFISWAVPRYEQFILDHPQETPSVERLDPYGHYELSNLAVIPLSVNRKQNKKTKTVTVESLAKLVVKLCDQHQLDISAVVAAIKKPRSF